MKTKLTLLVNTIFLVLVVASCTDDEGNALDIIGTYEVSSYTITNCQDPDDNDDGSQLGCSTEDGYETCNGITLDFREGGVLITTLSATITEIDSGLSQTETQDMVGTYSIEGNVVTICVDGECEDGEYTVSGNNLVIITDEDSGCIGTLEGSRVG